MAKDSHQRAAEFHDMAAHAHRAASAGHGKGDHLTGHEMSKKAMEHTTKAYEFAQDALKTSAKFAKGSKKKG